jgi:hypothetical protein
VKHQSTNNENLEKRKEESDKHTKEADVSTKVDESQDRNEQDEDEESDDDVCDNDLWIIGTSIVKDLYSIFHYLLLSDLYFPYFFL